MTSRPGFGFWLRTLLFRPRVLLAFIAAFPVSSFALRVIDSVIMLPRAFFGSTLPVLAVASVLVLIAAVWEMQSESFQKALTKNWRKAQVDMVRAELRAKEKSVLAVRGRPTFQRDRLRRMQTAQREFFDELGRLESGDGSAQQALVEQAVKAFSRYYELLQKEQRIAGLLESANRTEIEKDVARLEKQADATSSEARNQYLRAAEFRKQELRSLERAEQLSSLLQAHMDALESALASMRTRMINTTVWDASMAGNAYSDLTQELLALEKAYIEVSELEKDPLLELERHE